MGELRWTIDCSEGVVILDHDPQGWEDLKLKFVRDEIYHGIFYEFSGGGDKVVPLGFYCKGGGKEFIDQLYDKYGSEAVANLIISYRCLGGTFEDLYLGKLNFSSYDERFKNQKLYSFLNVEQFGITQKIRNREGTDVNLKSLVGLDGFAMNPLTFAPYSLNLHSKTIFLESTWEYELGTDQVFCHHDSGTSLVSWYGLIQMDLTKQDLTQSTPNVGLGVTNGLVFFTEFADLQILDTRGELYTLPTTLTITWDFSGNMVDESFTHNIANPPCFDDTLILSSRGTRLNQSELRLYIGVDLQTANANQNWITLATMPDYACSNCATITTAFSGSGTTTYSLQPGERIWLIWFSPYDVQTSNIVIKRTFHFDTSELSMSIDSNTSASTSSSVAIYEAWARLTESISQGSFRSTIFGRVNSQPDNYTSNGCHSFTAITSGKNIRGFNDSINTNLKDLFDSCDKVWNIGLGIENDILVAEVKKYFYDDTIIFQANFASGIEIKFSEQFVYNEMEAGFARWETEAVNGLDEPLTFMNYAFPSIKSIKNRLSIKSPYLGGMYAIELTRRKDSLNFPTDDFKYDNENFFICLNRTLGSGDVPVSLNIAEKNENITVTPGTLYFPQDSYNLRITPERNVMRWFPIYSIGQNKVLNYQNYWLIQLLNGQGNLLFESRTNVHPVPGCPGEFGYEQSGFFIGITLPITPQYQSPVSSSIVSAYPVPLAPFTISQLYGEPLFMPEEITFTHPVSYTEFKTIKNNPKGLVRISNDGLNYMTGYIKTFEFDLRKKMGTFVLYRKS